MILERVRRGVYEQARLVTGDRGVGKTVFLAHLADDATAQGRWPVEVAARRGDASVRDLMVRIAETLVARDAAAALTRGASGALRRIAGVQAGATGVRLEVRQPAATESVDRGRALADLLVEAARLARDRGAVLVLLLDEMQNASESALGDLCHALQHAQSTADIEVGPRGERLRRHLPLVVYLAGLPGLPDQIRRAGATFFERVAHLDFGLLGEPEVREALLAFAEHENVSIEQQAIDAMVEAIGGYPYFLHVVGTRVWQAGEGRVITAGEADEGIAAARHDVARLYDERLRGLGEVSHDWLAAAAALEPGDRTVGAVAAQLGATSDRYGWVASALTQQGLIRPAQGRGRFAFALPGLDAHIRSG